MLPACAVASEPGQPDKGSALSLSWRSCRSPEQPPFFDLHFLRDGTVRYIGNSDVREKGEHVARVNLEQIRRLAESATQALQASGSGHAPKVQRTKPTPNYCLTLMVGDGNSTLSGTLTPADPSARKLERLVQRTVDLRSWVCPTRGRDLADSAKCDLPTVSFGYAERENCGYSHSVNLYADGRVHYFAWGLADSDRYYEIDRAVVNRLYKIGSNYTGDLRLTGLPVDPDHRTLMGADMLIEYKQTLAQLAKVPWHALPERSDCSGTREYPEGWLALDRW